MKNFLVTALALACAVPALAQQGGQTPRGRLTTVTSSDPDWFTKTINLDFRNATLEEAVKKILEAAKIKLDKIDDQTQGRKSKLSLKLDDVNVRDALAAVSRLYGAQAFVLTEDGATTIELKKRTSDPVAPLRSFAPFPMLNGGFASSGGGVSFGPGNVFVTGSSERYKDLPDRKIDFEAKDKTLKDIMYLIMGKAGSKPGLILEVDKDLDTKENRMTLTMKGVSIGNVLDNLAAWLGCGWNVRKEDKDKKYGEFIRVRFSKEFPGPGYRFSMGPNGTAQVFTTPTPSMPLLPDLPIIGNLFRTSSNLNTRVSLDKKNTDVRECFKTLLKDADVSYALADDLPTDAKSFTFSNVPLALALDMICESIDVGWVAESGTNGKPVVRIGKRYKRRTGSGSFSTFSNSSFAPSVTRYRTRIPVDFMGL